MNVIGLIVILVVVFLPLGYMVWRFKQGEEVVAGGPSRRQTFGKDGEENSDDEAAPS